jgi:poly-gamma-glutamate synthesis protein (capsule biosynthesis protein)
VKFHKPNGSPDLSLLKDQISYCREQHCDIIIASLHWGYEYEFYPRKHQVKVAHDIVEAGADIIVAHHAHVIQPVEFYRTKRDPDRIALIAYSLGNLTTNFSAPHLVLSQVINLSMAKGAIKKRERTYIESAEIIPVIQVESEVDDLPAIRLKKLDAVLDEVKESEDEQAKEYLSQVAYYAELILGNGFH